MGKGYTPSHGDHTGCNTVAATHPISMFESLTPRTPQNSLPCLLHTCAHPLPPPLGLCIQLCFKGLLAIVCSGVATVSSNLWVAKWAGKLSAWLLAESLGVPPAAM